MKNNTNDSILNLKIKYKPLYVGTKKSHLNFYSGQPNLDFLLNSKEKKLFVTDDSIFNLSYLKSFFSQFEKIKEETISSLDKKLENRNINYSYQIYKAKNCGLIVIPHGESFKTINTVLSIVKTALYFSLTRKDTFTAIGGGVITDITAFAASIYKRGASCEFVPTTLLAMVDAAIGGKTGCDFEEYKNITGTFFPAKALYIFPDFIQSLPQNEFISGFAEAIKTAILFDKKLYSFIKEKKDKILNKDKDVLFKIIMFCAKAKAKVVEKDLSEKNIRMLLNLGHTFGHALESRAGLGKLTHGECVAWGICRAIKTSHLLGLATKEYYEEICNTLNSFGYESNAKHPAYSDSDKIIERMKNDKKNSSSKIRLILQKNISKNIITEVSDKIIKQALEEN